ncbi:MAG: WecB/TagA/CpsF family glycosyltransferase [Bacteroidota bacterium]|nr:WecB/TagA/CpsF family glycosyltransferase [Bacteroidota bacterium]
MKRAGVWILKTWVDATSYADATHRVLKWAKEGESRYACVATVHTVMEAWDDPGFRAVVNEADLVTPDGMPLVWMLRRLGYREQERVYGPDLTLHLCAAAAREGIPVGFYGGRPEALDPLVCNLKARFRGLEVAYAWSPPFRPLTEVEDAQVVARIRSSGVRILFVGLGCPKQERWMAQHRGRLPVAMVGVGAAFDFHAGRLPQAPRWMQRSGLEWCFRLFLEPRRLWRRYLKHNPRFVVLASWQLLQARSRNLACLHLISERETATRGGTSRCKPPR